MDKETLLTLCLDYDKAIGCYPDDEYAGQSLYEFLLFNRGEHLEYSSWEERSMKYEERLEAHRKISKGYFGSFLMNAMKRKEESEVKEE
jgi:hypothetical protein